MFGFSSLLGLKPRKRQSKHQNWSLFFSLDILQQLCPSVNLNPAETEMLGQECKVTAQHMLYYYVV